VLLQVVNAGLSEIFSHGVTSLLQSDSSPKWSAFLRNLRTTTEFFAGAPEGTWEEAKRMEQARKKFAEKYPTESGAAAAAAPASSTPASTGPVSEENKARAEQAKNEGNALLGKQDNQGAAAKYTEAINLNPQHAIYYANRAAAYVNLKEYRKAVADCRASIAIDPAYPKSHYRLGQSYAALNEYEQALDAFNDALERSGKDDGMKVTIREQIAVCTRKMNAQQVGEAQPHAGGADPFAALSGMMGGAGGPGGMDFGALLNNPMISNMMQVS
jgi:small glutamine-rich tetratricopeptide repeat-containing protein alpha